MESILGISEGNARVKLNRAKEKLKEIIKNKDMDFNDIQSAWKNEKPENVILPTNLEKLKSANMPLDKIKKNLKNEFIYQIISIVFIGFVPFIYNFPENAFAPFICCFSIFVAVCIYYLVKLYLFYKRLNKTTLNTKDSFYETYFDIG